MSTTYIAIQRFAEAVRTQRQLNGWSQDKLAALCEVDRKTINRLERGVHSPSLVVALKAAHLLDIDLSYLISATAESAL